MQSGFFMSLRQCRGILYAEGRSWRGLAKTHSTWYNKLGKSIGQPMEVTMLYALASVMPEPGSPVAGMMSIIVANIIAWWGPLCRMVRRMIRRTILIEEAWKALLRRRQETSPAVTIDLVLQERARSNPDIVLAAQIWVHGEVWFCNPHNGKIASMPFSDIREAA